MKFLPFLFILVTLIAALVTLPAYAAPADPPSAPPSAPRLVPTPNASTVDGVMAYTRPGRCEVPVLWYSLGEQRFDTKCRPRQRERGTLDLQPQLAKTDIMLLLIEWRIVSPQGLKYKCTGFIAYDYRQNLAHYLYSVRVKPGENLHSAQIFTDPDGWTALRAETTAQCIKPGNR